MLLPLIGLVPLLPLAGFLVCGLLGRRLPKGAVGAVACGSILLAFLLSLGAVLELRSLPSSEVARAGTAAHGGGAAHEAGGTEPADEHDAAHGAVRSYTVDYWTWLPPMPFGGPLEPSSGRALTVPFGFRLDPLSSVMVLIVTGVGLLIHVYSTGYMAHDAGYARYFAYLNLFMAMMLTLVLADNFLVMFVGWEGVGLCSYLLIGFWFEDIEKSQAGRKAFITNRIGDFGFILGLLGILYVFGTLDFSRVMDAVDAGRAWPWALSAIAMALFVGACGKSAQIPLYVWLPDAMAGPTPVSALIHAATMVTAGVYMVARCASLFAQAPGVLFVIAVVGAATALLAATIALAQNDIKKVLAYSTVSQLGFMFVALGVGAFSAAIFHLMTHAFFKALLFLGAGSVIHAMSGEQDLWKMGGLARKLPWTYRTMLVGSLAIAGIPILSGFFSKDEILWSAWKANQPVLWATAAAASALTAFYMFRMMTLAFGGAFRGTAEQEHHLHESPPSMVAPLVLLAVLAIAGGWIGIPHIIGRYAGIPNLFEDYVGPVFANAVDHLAPHTPLGFGLGEGRTGAAAERVLMLVAVTLAVGGILLARRRYGASTLERAAAADRPVRAGAGRPAGAPVQPRRAGPVAALLARAYYVDEFYDATVLRLYRAGTRLFDGFDRWIVDGLVNSVAAFTELLGQVLRLFQTGFVRNYALWVFLGAIALVWMIGRA